jgi:hypothetical protein
MLRPSFFLQGTNVVLPKHVGAYQELQVKIAAAENDQPILLLCLSEMFFLIATTTFLPTP